MGPRQEFNSPHVSQVAPRNIWHSAGTAIVAANPRLAWTLLKQAGSAGWKSSLLNLELLGSLFKETFSYWTEDKAPRLGAALAYYTIFSLAPLLIIAIAVAGLVFGAKAAQGSVVEQIGGLVGQRGAEAIQTILQSAHKPAIGTIVGIFGVATLLFGASGVFGELQDALNTVWHVPTRQMSIRQCIKDRFPCFVMVLGIGFLLMVSLLLSAALAAVGKFLGGYLPISENLLHVLSFLVSFGISTLLFAMIFKILPQTPVAWSDVWVGAVVTALLFDVGKLLIGLYLGKSSIASTYGAASSLAIVLAWLYYSAQILYFGAEFTRVYASRHGSRSDQRAGLGSRLRTKRIEQHPA
jgi:membrane protein